MDTRTASLLRRVQEALPRSAGNLASEISDFLSAALPQDLPDSHFSAAIQREGRWEVFAELRTQVDSLPLHPHKRKVVRDWLDEAARAAPPPAQAPAAAQDMEACISKSWDALTAAGINQAGKPLWEVIAEALTKTAAAPAESEGEDSILLTPEDVAEARRLIHECTATDFISGDCKHKRDRGWVYERLCKAANLLLGDFPGSPWPADFQRKVYPSFEEASAFIQEGPGLPLGWVAMQIKLPARAAHQHTGQGGGE